MLRTLTIASALAVGLCALAYADDHHHGYGYDDVPGANWITHDQATQKLLQLGYSQILKLKADDGYWKAKVIKDGDVYKVRLDPRSGEVAAQYRDYDHD